MDGKRERTGLWRLRVLAVASATALGGLLWTSTPAESTNSVCGWVREKWLVNTSVPVGTYCANSDDPRCEPGFPATGGNVFGIADYFVCLDW